MSSTEKKYIIVKEIKIINNQIVSNCKKYMIATKTKDAKEPPPFFSPKKVLQKIPAPNPEAIKVFIFE